jgi:Tol biopolymer transport system component
MSFCVLGRAAALLVGMCLWALAQTSPSRLQTTTAISLGARVDYSPVKQLIAYDQTGSDTLFDVYTIFQNGTSKKCLTCGAPIPQGQNGNPTWHPSGEYILFQNEDTSLAVPPLLAPIWYRASNPGYGTNNNLWLMTSDATQFWQLTSVQSGQGVLHPQWSHDGKRITWAAKLSSDNSTGEWQIQIADLVWTNGVPSLANIQSLAPFGTSVFYETHSFSPDDKKILFSGGDPSNSAVSLDIYLIDIVTGAPQNLTNSPGVWDEHAHYSPDGTKIVWGSSAAINNPRSYFVPFTDYWAMNADGSGKQRLTYFNTPGYAEYYPNGLVCADFTFGPSSAWIIGSLEQNQVPSPASSMRYFLNVLKLRAATTP